MASLKDIRKRIDSVKRTQKTTSAMKMVSAAKLRRSEDNIREATPYAVKLKDMFIDIDKSGKSIFTDENNNTFHLDSKEERIRLIKETPNIFGAHAGGNWEARRQSHKDVVSFFKKHLRS